MLSCCVTGPRRRCNRAGQLVNGSTGQRANGSTGQRVNRSTGRRVDGLTGQPVNRSTGQRVDAYHFSQKRRLTQLARMLLGYVPFLHNLCYFVL